MSKQLATVVIGLAIVAVIVGGILLSTRKNRVELTGEVLKVRSYQADPEHTITIVDFRVNNPSTQQFVVRDLEVYIDDPDGKPVQGDVFSETDIQRVISYYSTLGKKYTPGLLRRDKIDSGATTDRSVAFNAPMTDERLAARKNLRIVVFDVDGARTEIAEKK